MRADAAHALGDDALATSLLDEVRQVTLGADRDTLADELSRAEELRLSLA
jgi:hypothetical protein